MAKNKKKTLAELKPTKYTVYGIFDFKKNKLIYIDLDYDTVELEFSMSDYNDDFDIITFDVVLN